MGQIKSVEPASDAIQSYGDMTVEVTDKWYQLERKSMYYYAQDRGVFNQYRVIRETTNRIYVLVSKHMYDEFVEICEEYAISREHITRPPDHGTAPCGILTTRVVQHQGRCPECRVTKGKGPVRYKGQGAQAGSRKRDGAVKTVFALPELGEFSLNGLLELMDKYRDEAVDIAANLEKSVTAVSEVQALFKRLAEIREASPHLSAAMDHFLEVK